MEPSAQHPQHHSGQPPAPAYMPRPSAAMAITSLVLSITGLLSGFLFIGILLALAAVILGIVALATKRGGKALAIVGLSVGGFCLLISPLTVYISVNFWQGFAEGYNEAVHERSQ